VNGQLHAMADFTPGGKVSDTCCIGDCVGPTANLDAKKDNVVPAGNRTSAVKSSARHYTDRAVTAVTKVWSLEEKLTRFSESY
jgi:hypothetical protein